MGIIDTIHLLEVAKSIMAMQDSGYIPQEDLIKIKDWFIEYLNWITTHPYGISERDNGNNHSVCWALQVAVFSELVGNTEQSKFVRNMYKNELLPQQLALDGSFPLELKRTKPYGYSLFNLDVMTALCQVLSTQDNSLFSYTTDNGKGIKKGLSFLYSYVEDKNLWPNGKDVMYWDEWPVRHPFLIFSGLALENQDYIGL
nr:alginate lyase family protein [Maribacter luteus]